jgi:hypothetical protein
LLGVNLLRHVRPTFDLIGGQFVVRRYEPPPPPVATTLKVSYVRGGGMLLRGAFGSEATAAQASFLVDTSIVYPVARVAASRHPHGAAFVRWLHSPAARAIFVRHGFSTR